MYSQFLAHHHEPLTMHMFSHRPDDFIYSIFIDKVRERTRKYRQIPEDDICLISKCISALLIYRAKDSLRMKLSHKCAWPIVKGLSSYACIICIHHSVNKPYSEPLSYEIQLYVYDFFKQSESWILKFFEFWVMPANSIIYQSFHIFLSSIILCKLKSSYSDM